MIYFSHDISGRNHNQTLRFHSIDKCKKISINYAELKILGVFRVSNLTVRISEDLDRIKLMKTIFFTGIYVGAKGEMYK